MGNNNRVVLAVFAHPDDDELTCFGTLARLHHEGFRIYVLELTAGERSTTAKDDLRLVETGAAARLIGYSAIRESLPDGKLKYDIETVSLIEKHIRNLSPQVVITHYPQALGQGHQDHIAVASAVVNAARRSECIEWILYAEPPTQNGDFTPNYFVDVTEYIDLKKQAVGTHKSEMTKPYMRPDMIETRARWWAIQVHPGDYNRGRFYEAFIVVKGILSQNSPHDLGL